MRASRKVENAMQIPMLASLLSHHPGDLSAKQAAAIATTKRGGTAATASSSSTPSTTPTANPAGSAGITANDFLALLVTEMKNQDPTNQTDPMQYITQLVGVNSLEQLVQINKDLAPPSSTPGSSTPPATTGAAMASAVMTSPTSSAVASASPLSLPAGGHIQMSDSSHAVAQAFETSVPKAAQASPTQLPPKQLPPAHVAIQPEELRAIQMSIPGATLSGASTSGVTAVPPSGVTGGGLR